MNFYGEDLQPIWTPDAYLLKLAQEGVAAYKASIQQTDLTPEDQPA